MNSPTELIQKNTACSENEQAVFLLMGLPSATLAWYKQPPAMRVCIKSYTKKSPIVLQ